MKLAGYFEFKIQEITVDISLFFALIYILRIFLGDRLQMSIKYHYDPDILCLVLSYTEWSKTTEQLHFLMDCQKQWIPGAPKEIGRANYPNFSTPFVKSDKRPWSGKVVCLWYTTTMLEVLQSEEITVNLEEILYHAFL